MKRILEKVLAVYLSPDTPKCALTYGICRVTYLMRYTKELPESISMSEFWAIDKFIYDKLGLVKSHRDYAWPQGEKKSRIKWLKQQIKSL